MATKKQLESTNITTSKALDLALEDNANLKEQLELQEVNKNRDFVQVSKDPGIPYMLTAMLNPVGRVYFTLVALANYQNMVQVTIGTLSEILNMDARSIRKYLKTLRDIGCLEIVKYGTNNIYILNPDITWAASNTQRQFCRFEGSYILPMDVQAQIEEASASLDEKRRSMSKPNTV